MTARFSVLVSVYKNDDSLHFREAIESASIRQTLQPDELLIMVDGPVPEALNDVILSLQQEIPYINVYWSSENQGLGRSLQKGVTLCKNELIARMDADDISTSTRFEQQINFLEQHPEVDIVGGNISEFIEDVANVVGVRECPPTDSQIKVYMRKRCAMNHVTVMFKKSTVLSAGNYQEWFYNEDYYLWVRMMLNKAVFANLPYTLVHVRVGMDMYSRRGGRKYYNSEKRLQKFMLAQKLISPCRYLFNVFVRWVVQILMTSRIRSFVFQKLLRK